MRYEVLLQYMKRQTISNTVHTYEYVSPAKQIYDI